MSGRSPLSEVQRAVAGYLRRRRALHALPDAVAFAEAEIGGNSRLSPVEQLEIYREQFWLRHTSALLEDFPGLSGILGQKDWETLAEEYLTTLPPASFSLRDLGRALPAFVASASSLPHRELCADMARLEWAYVEAFDAEDAPLLDPADLGRVPESAWDSARVKLGPSLSLLRAAYPVVELREQLTRNDAHVGVPERAPTCIAVCRRGLSVRAYTEPPEALLLLEKLRAGLSLLPAIEATAAESAISIEALAPELGGWFAHFAQSGIVVGVIT